jgi:hypothetical protein
MALRLSALCAGCPLPLGTFLVLISRIYTLYKSQYCSTHKVQPLHGNGSQQWRFLSIHTCVLTDWWFSCNSSCPQLTHDGNSWHPSHHWAPFGILAKFSRWPSLYILETDRIENTASNSSSVDVCIRCPNKCHYLEVDSDFWLHDSGLSDAMSQYFGRKKLVMTSQENILIIPKYCLGVLSIYFMI